MSDTEQPQTAGGPEIKFTEKEEKVLKAVWQCMKTAPEVDMKKLTEKAGFNTEKTCSNTWGTIKKKLTQLSEQTGGVATTPKKTSTPRKRQGAGASDNEASESPSKKPRKPSAKKTKVPEHDIDAAEGADDDVGTSLKKARKPAAKNNAKVDAAMGDGEDSAEADAADGVDAEA